MLARLLRRWANHAATAQLDQVLRRNQQLRFFMTAYEQQLDDKDAALRAYRHELDALAREAVRRQPRCTCGCGTDAARWPTNTPRRGHL